MTRRFLAVISLAILWALEWAVFGAPFGVYQFYLGENYAIINPPVWAGPFWALVLLTAISFAKAGALSGALFAIVLALAEPRQSVTHLRLSRIALWGVVGAWLIPATLLLISLARFGIQWWGFVLEYLVIVGIAGGVSATTTLLLARRGVSNAAA
jgi:hypothetical protein